MEQMEKTMKKEGAVHSDTEIYSNFLMQDPGLLQSVKREISLTNDVLVKEEILEDGGQAASTEQMEKTIKKEGEVAEAAASSSAHNDTETYSNFLKQDSGLLQSVKRELSFTNDALVKEEILEDSTQADSEQQYVEVASTSTGTGGVNEACSTYLGDLFNIKYESAEIDIGPTVLQPMDIHYTINKHNMSAAMEENTISDDCNGAMPGSGGRKGRIENKQRDFKTTSHNCNQTTTVIDYNEAHMKTLLTPHVRLENKDLQKLLHQLRTTSSNVFKCDWTIHKPHLQSASNKLHRRNSRRAVTTRGPVAGSSNQSGDVRMKTKQKSLSCDVGGKSYSSKAGLNLHKRLHCSVELKNHVVNYESHKRETHCIREKKFALSGDITKQARFHKGEKPFHCKTCDAKFSRIWDFTRHKRVHTGEKPFQCKTCDAKFAQRNYLTKHMKVHTGEKPFQCATCDVKISVKQSLISHMRVHTGEKPFQCKTCDGKFTHKCQLTRHMEVHTVEKPFQCATCDGKFLQKRSLISHMRVHMGEKPFQCKTCNGKFAHKSGLTRHMKVHTGETQCETCDAKFTRKTSLINHMRVHTREKPFQCETCDAKFTRKTSIINHMRVHTG